MSADLLLTRLQGVRKTGAASWVAKCPAHEDKRPSLSITETPDGRILLHDHAGCASADVLAAVGLGFADLFPNDGHDDVGRRKGWRSAKAKEARQTKVRIPASTVLVAVAHDATEAAVLVSDVAEGKAMLDDVRLRLFELAGRIADALRVAGVA